MSPPPPPPPPAPSCASSGNVQSHNWSSNDPNKMYYHQPHTHETNGPHECSYNKSSLTLLGLRSNPGGSAYDTMVSRLCGYTENLTFQLPGTDGMCAEQGAAVEIAKAYCGQGDNIITSTDVCGADTIPGGDATYQALLNTYCTANNVHIKDSGHACSGLKTSSSALYDTISAAFCEANPNDSFCSCYNVVKDKCADDSTTGVAGCNHPSGAAYVKNRNATPSDQKSLWDGQRKCGSVCTGANKYIPPNDQAGCKTTIQICSQEINVQNAKDSEITAQCELNAEDGSSGGGGGGGGDTEQETITIPRSVEEVRSFLPTNLNDVRTSKKKQVGVATMGGSFMSVICVILLIIAGTMGAGPVARRRFR